MRNLHTIHVAIHSGEYEGIQDLFYWEQWIVENVTAKENFKIDFCKDTSDVGLIHFNNPALATMFRLTAPEYINRSMIKFKNPVNISANWYERK